jgi:hypothetical protein
MKAAMDASPFASESKRFQALKPRALLVLLLAVFEPLSGMAQPARIFFGDLAHPVVSGEAWLVANRWGVSQGVLVATIREGHLEAREALRFPQYWEQAFDYQLLLAVADRPVGPPKSMVEDFAFSTFDVPEYLRRFSAIYLSPAFGAGALGKDWPTALQQMGYLTDAETVLPRPARRTVRLLYPDGKPLAGAWVNVFLHGSSHNHCGAEVGINLGGLTTNADGEIFILAPNSSLALGIRYFEQETVGPAGTAFLVKDAVVIGGDLVTTVERLWTLPKHDYVLHLRTAGSQPIANAHLSACMNFDGCGAGCGPVRAPKSDASGTIRFRSEDLREMRSLTVTSEEGKERNLTDREMRELLTTYQLNLRWD